MIDWCSTMEQTFEFYVVDPASWKDKFALNTITSCTINRDLSADTLGSATINSAEVIDENYVRVYLVVVQNGVKTKVPLGAFLVQTPSIKHDGKVSSISMDAYTPLVELKGSSPPIGYSLLKDQTIMDVASRLCEENLRAPVVAISSENINSENKLLSNFTSNLNDTWMSFLKDLVSMAKYRISLDEMGRIIFEPVMDTRSLQPVWTYNDDNSSILRPNFTDERDLYDVPNVVEVVYSTGSGYRVSRIVNDDPNSPVSTVNRGWEKLYRETNPNFSGVPSQRDLDAYAKQILRNRSNLEHTITYTHGYCPVRIGDCVLLNNKRMGLINVKAKVISQSIQCETGCQVEETAVYNTNLWG